MTDQPNAITGEIAPTEPNKATLYKKMAAVMGHMSRVKKTGQHPTQKYMFATDGDVSDMVRDALSQEGIAFFADFIEIDQKVVGKTSSGGDIRNNFARFIFTFACSETGATRSCTWFAEAVDTSDKGINKVATAAVKYFLLKTFLISTGDKADDPDTSEDMQPGKAKTQQRQQLPPEEIQAAAEHLGTGTNGRRVPVKPTAPAQKPSVNGNENQSSDGKVIQMPDNTPKVAGDTKIEALDKVVAEEYMGKGNKKAIRFKTSTGSYSYTRAPFTAAGIDTEQWTKVGTYTFDGTFNVISKWHQPEDPKAQGYWKIDSLDPMGKAEAEIFPTAPPDDIKDVPF